MTRRSLSACPDEMQTVDTLISYLSRPALSEAPILLRPSAFRADMAHVVGGPQTPHIRIETLLLCPRGLRLFSVDIH